MAGFLDFINYVGEYEVWSADRIPEKQRLFPKEDLDTPYLVQTGPASVKLIKGEALEMAVRLLLDATLPRTPDLSRKESVEITKDEILYGDEEASRRYSMRKSARTKHVPRADFTDFEKTVLKVAGRIGMLGHFAGGHDPETDRGYLRIESLDRWLDVADTIQAMFYGRDARRVLPEDFVMSFGNLEILIGYRAEETEMRLRPDRLSSALFHHAGEMLAMGTKLQPCQYCGKPFLSGGAGRGGGKRRGDARFHSDECRYNFHNEARRKSARKRKL